jgi:ornithine cyclodeaminase
VAGTVAEAVAGADIVCTTTASTQPLLSSVDVPDGAHVNAVGAVFPDRRELAADLVARAEVFVDSRESALRESGDLLFAIAEGRFHAEGIRGEIGEILSGRHPGRTRDDEVTVFESLGLAVEDVLSAHYLWARATELGLGVEVPFGL